MSDFEDRPGGVVAVRFTPEELAAIERCAQARQDIKRPRGIPNERVGRRVSEFETERMGLMGESAVSAYFKLPWDLTARVGGRPGPERRVTHRLPGGATFQVNYSRWGDFIVNNEGDFEAQFGILVMPEASHDLTAAPDVAKIVGYIERGWFLHEAEEHDYQYGPRLRVTTAHLRPVAQLRDRLTLKFV